MEETGGLPFQASTDCGRGTALLLELSGAAKQVCCVLGKLQVGWWGGGATYTGLSTAMSILHTPNLHLHLASHILLQDSDPNLSTDHPRPEDFQRTKAASEPLPSCSTKSKCSPNQRALSNRSSQAAAAAAGAARAVKPRTAAAAATARA